MVYPTNCCSALAAVLATKVSFPGSQGYQESLDSYFSAQEMAVEPACIASPDTTPDVSKAVATLSHSNCSFAIRSGGRSAWPGDANIAGGVTIDLSGLNGVHVSDDASVATVGPGARWGEVYKELVNHDRIVAGGRVGTVGVGGLTLGGGISSWGPRYGWTCDSIVNAEVVLAGGAVVDANATHNADLLRALRGASNNFGVVTRIDFQAHEQGDIWGGVVSYGVDTIHQQLAATSYLASADPYDEYASLVVTLGYTPGGGQSVVDTLHYTKPVEYPDFFRPFTDIPHGNTTLRVANVSNFADEGAAANPSGGRGLLATTSHGSSLQMLEATYEAWNRSLAAFDGLDNIVFGLLIEPIPQVVYHAASPGTNTLGLDGSQGGLVVLGVTAIWEDESLDALVDQVAKDVVTEIDTRAKELGEYFDYKFLNYANYWQDVIGSYGAENVAELRRVSRKYDPTGVFQRNVPGGFKLF